MTTLGTWFTAAERVALLDFWRVYDRHYEELQEKLLRSLETHSTFGPVLATTPAAQLEAQNRESRANLVRAIEHDEWAPYRAQLRFQGEMYADLGISFSDWYDVIRLFEQELVPLLVAEYAADVSRLTRALGSSREFINRAMAEIGESYIAKKARALQASEQRLAITIDSIGDAVISTDERTRVERVNRAAERLLKLPADECIGKPLSDVFRIENEVTRETVSSPVDRVLREGVVVGLANHTALIRPDGTRVPIADSAAPIRDAEGVIRGVVLVFRDVSEERALGTERERATELSARRAAAVDAALDAIVGMDHEGRVTSFNPAAEKMFGHATTDAIGKQVADLLIPPHLQQAHRAGLSDYVATGRSRILGKRLELSANRADGSQFPVELTVVRIPINGPPEFTAFVRDLTEKKRVEDALRRSEQLLSTTLASIHEGVTLADETGRIVFRNRAAIEIAGAPTDNVHGFPESFKIFYADGTPCPPEDNVLARALRGEQTRDLELLLKDVDPMHGIAISVNAGPIRDDAGAIRGAVASFRDVTHRKRLELQRDREHELELRNQRLQEASRMKSEFLANMSHELRTPLNAIIGLSKLLYDGKVHEADKQKEFLGDIVASGRHLLQLINDVLDLSKVEAGKLQFDPEPLTMTRVISEVTSILRTTATSKQIRIDTRVASELGEVVLDAGRLKQVLYNYLSNALKFTPERGTVTLHVEPSAGDQFRLAVVDTGPGITKEDQAKLFVEFQQLDGGAAKEHGGTGLGLALTKRLVEAQGGSVGVLSEPGRGSEFFAILPRRMQPNLPRSTGGFAWSKRLGAPMVLVVEDDPRDQETIAKTLTESGYSVEVAPNGRAAVALARSKPYVAITLDLLLPDMSGLDVLRMIRAESRNREVPIVVITVVTERATGGFVVNGVLPKPPDGDALVNCLRQSGVAAPPATVLVVDDDRVSLKLMADALERLRYHPVCYSDARSALRDLADVKPTAIVLDLLMPELDGLEFLNEIRRSVEYRNVPVIVWTTKDLTIDELQRLRSTAHAIIQKGAADLVDELRIHLGSAAPRGS